MICIKDLIVEKGEFTNATMFEFIIEYLKTLPELMDAFEILDYTSTEWRRVCDLTQDTDYEAFAHVNTGGCEGIYIDFYLQNEEERIDLGTMKTLAEVMDGYIKLGQIAGAFILAADNYLWFNEHKFKLKEKEKGDCIDYKS